jgi:hypothetical protein
VQLLKEDADEKLAPLADEVEATCSASNEAERAVYKKIDATTETLRRPKRLSREVSPQNKLNSAEQPCLHGKGRYSRGIQLQPMPDERFSVRVSSL